MSTSSPCSKAARELYSSCAFASGIEEIEELQEGRVGMVGRVCQA